MWGSFPQKGVKRMSEDMKEFYIIFFDFLGWQHQISIFLHTEVFVIVFIMWKSHIIYEMLCISETNYFQFGLNLARHIRSAISGRSENWFKMFLSGWVDIWNKNLRNYCNDQRILLVKVSAKMSLICEYKGGEVWVSEEGL